MDAWERFIPFLDYDVEIRRVICTTNAIESLNARFKRSIRARGHFPDEQAALKCMYLTVRSLDPTGKGRIRWLKHADIYAKTTWVAQYGARMGFDSFPTDSRGWQYTGSGKVDGISGNVDMNAFGNREYVNDGSSNDLQAAIDVRKMTAVAIPNGNYYINVRSKVASSVDIPSGSAVDSTAIQLYSGNSSKAQQFTFTRQSDGSYEIVNVNSGKALDVRNGVAENNAIVQQYSRNNS